MRVRFLHLLILLLSLTGSRAQENPAVRLMARSLPDKVLLRWAVDQPMAWKQAQAVGFWVERTTLVRNGAAVDPIERKLLTPTPLKPSPLEAWEALAKQDMNAAIIAQALYGDSFEVVPPGDQIAAIYAVNDELEQRFTFALIAAEQHYEASKLAGWALEDTTVLPGEKYVYAVSVAFSDSANTFIEKGVAYGGTELYEALPQPLGLAGVFSDGKVALSWNFNLLRNVYTNYIVERSTDNVSFEQLNGTPIFNAQHAAESENVPMFYMDSIPNGPLFYYRIKGRNAFGETGPNSEVLQGKAEAELGAVPHIYSKELPSDDEVILRWEFKEEGNKLIDKFQLRRSSTNKGPFTIVADNIPITSREITFKGLGRVNYFIISAIGKNGKESESYATLVQPVDSLPPRPPVGLTGIADTTGIVTLRWAKNLEDDLGGYRIYRSPDPKLEYAEVTKAAYNGEVYADTVPVADLNQKVYYKIVAEDQRHNRSGYSEVLLVKKPDVVPPTSPAWSQYEVTLEGVRVAWIPSGSSDVLSHTLYRQRKGMAEGRWEKIFESRRAEVATYLDADLNEPGTYSYTVIATDSTGLESLPIRPINVVWSGKVLMEKDIKFMGAVDRELRFIHLSWKVADEQVLEYLLFKGESGQPLKLYKTLDGASKGFNDTDLEINSDYTYGLQVLLRGGRTSLITTINLKY